ncbi:preprotein translocase subunit SecA [Oleiagrimonas soli]|uniref:Protein translocase subunit SecA n=1 Tax=Oleiagrimonas soli TaxID=1543381 RepID=A0A099CTS2_9GAMM|nr:preprotein translocase subunit SecA [Oleiagrimonas soli]KGI77051.1 preprotein translocase subunit SecA [Oleiagrimonas soli]MBB6185422.1 preprotein translocase subunit SecA [Oleiagrimonas soli]
MFNRLLTSVFGSRNERVLRQLSKIVARINALEPDFEQLSDDALRAKTDEFRTRLADGATLDQLLPEAFATVREASKRVLGMRHYDVQLIGGMVLHQGKIAEMRTGEGKTLVATLPVYLNALEGKGVHVVTVNDYLARRDAAQMGKVYGFLGLTTGVVWPDMNHEDKHAAYAADITYGTNNEFGFDYLRDNMALSSEQRYQRSLHYAIVDEVDSILIDEARTPLIISGPAEDSPQLYVAVNKIVPHMTRQENEEAEGDYWADEKQKQVHLSEEGMEHAEQLLRQAGVIEQDSTLYDSANLAVVHHLNAALRAHALYQRDTDYIVRDGEVIIVDEFTGRTLAGRRWSEGLHQAVEAKEGVPIQRENQTLATVTFQNLFRMYKKLSGMTGTADTEAYEFQSIYGLEVVVIPTNEPMIRKDHSDIVFLSQEYKFKAIVEDIRDCQQRKQPVLVGTTSIEVSELLANELRKQGIKHEVLNAKQHEREAHIVAQAGAPGSVTIATNMAGRGTDIVLGGSLEADMSALPEDATDVDRARVKSEWQKRHDAVLASGGLHIIGTERHESRRIDNQLRGRSGRQGDPGSSRFYLSLQDNLVRIFAGERVGRWMRAFGMKEEDALEDRMISRQIEKAQRKVEQHNFDIRKHLLEFDDTANDQRKVIYNQRRELLESDDVSDTVRDIRDDVFTSLVSAYVPPESIDDQWDIAGLDRTLQSEYDLHLDLQRWIESQHEIDAEMILEHVREAAEKMFADKEAQIGAETMRQLEKHIMLSVLDNAWKEHLASMDYLRQSIHLRSYAQQQPKQEFKRESFLLFSKMLDRIKSEVTQMLARVRIRSEEEVAALEAEQRRQAQAKQLQYQHAEARAIGDEEDGGEGAPHPETPVVRDGPKVGRNDPCPCGSGRKYKHCHGRLD